MLILLRSFLSSYYNKSGFYAVNSFLLFRVAWPETIEDGHSMWSDELMWMFWANGFLCLISSFLMYCSYSLDIANFLKFSGEMRPLFFTLSTVL